MRSIAAIILVAFITKNHAEQTKSSQTDKLVGMLTNRATKPWLLRYADLDSITLAKPGVVRTARSGTIRSPGPKLLASGHRLWAPSSKFSLATLGTRTVTAQAEGWGAGLKFGEQKVTKKEPSPSWQLAYEGLVNNTQTLTQLAELSCKGYDALGRGAVLANYVDEDEDDLVRRMQSYYDENEDKDTKKDGKTRITTKYIPMYNWIRPEKGWAPPTLLQQLETYDVRDSFVLVVKRKREMGSIALQSKVVEQHARTRTPKGEEFPGASALDIDDIDERVEAVLGQFRDFSDTKNQTAKNEEMKQQRQAEMQKWINDVNLEEDEPPDVMDLTQGLKY